MDRCTLLGALEPVLRYGYGAHTLCNPTVLTRLREIGRNLSVFGQTWRTAPGEGRTLLLWGRQSHNVNGLYPLRRAVVSPCLGDTQPCTAPAGLGLPETFV